jgi:proteasome lid subunit RPN8/RPN11
MTRKPEFLLSFKERRRLHDRASRAQQKDHLEVCGAVVANGDGHLRLIFLENKAEASYRFVVRRRDLAEVRRGLRGSGERLIGTFHSHPIGLAKPSPRDRKLCGLRTYLLIYDVCGREAKLWRLTKDGARRRVSEVSLGAAQQRDAADGRRR